MVFSLIVNTPPIVISWSEKYNDIMSSFGIKKFCVDSHEPAIIMIDTLLDEFDEIKKEIDKNLLKTSHLIDTTLNPFLKLILTK